MLNSIKWEERERFFFGWIIILSSLSELALVFCSPADIFKESLALFPCQFCDSLLNFRLLSAQGSTSNNSNSNFLAKSKNRFHSLKVRMRFLSNLLPQLLVPLISHADLQEPYPSIDQANSNMPPISFSTDSCTFSISTTAGHIFLQHRSALLR